MEGLDVINILKGMRPKNGEVGMKYGKHGVKEKDLGSIYPVLSRK